MYAKMRVFSITVLVLLMTVITVSAAPTVIRFSHAVSNNTPKGQMALKFKSLVEERMKDKFVVEVYPNSEMFDDDRIFQALLLDDVQMGAPSLSKFGRYTKKLQIYDLPFLFQNMEAVDAFQQSETGQELLGAFQHRGLLGLGYLHNGLKQMSATKKLVKPEDAKGLKFRIMSSEVLVAQFKAVGAVPEKKPFSQVYNLLSSGALNGQENTWSNIYSKKFYEVQPFITESNHGVLDYMVVTSMNFWEGLTTEDQKALRSVIDEAIAHGNSLAVSKAKVDRKKVIESKKAEIIQLSQAERSEWVKVMRPVWKKFEEQIGADLIDKAYSMNK